MNPLSTQTTQYLLHPRAPLVFGMGKPLDFGLGGDSLNFPCPTTVAAALRAAHSSKTDSNADPYATIEGLQLQQLALARFNWLNASEPTTLMLPRPADVVYLNGRMLSLRPTPTPDGCWTDLAPGLLQLALQGNAEDKKGKPDPAPAWWAANDYCKWLEGSSKNDCTPFSSPGDLSTDNRTHVVIDPEGKGAVQSGLFRSSGRDFGADAASTTASGSHGFAIALSVKEPQSLHGEIRRLGGEGRFVRFEACKNDVLWQSLKQPEGLDKAELIRCVLTTPAVFEQKGWHPDTLGFDEKSQTICGDLTIQGESSRVQLLAAAISRSMSYSGWQKDAQGKGGPGRPWRVVPAGSVYWLRVKAGDAPKLWGQSLCSNTEHAPWLDNGWGRSLVGLD